jgi:nucleotide-binding universal stress UspA family protein
MATSQASIAAAVSYKTILLATDFLSSSDAALPCVQNLARLFDSTVIVAHAVPFESLYGVAAVPPVAGIDIEWQSAREAMNSYKARHAFTGLRHEFLLERGNTCGVIADLVEHRHVDLVVVGSHGRHGLLKLFSGSIAEQIFRTVSCPVLTAGPAVKNLPENWSPRRILFSTEFAPRSTHAFQHAFALAETFHAELVLQHILPLVMRDEQPALVALYEKRLRDLLPAGSEQQLSITFDVCFRLPEVGILETAQQRDIDLIVMDVHRAHFPRWDAHMPGDSLCDVISKAHCPVLTVSG